MDAAAALRHFVSQNSRCKGDGSYSAPVRNMQMTPIFCFQGSLSLMTIGTGIARMEKSRKMSVAAPVYHMYIIPGMQLL